MATAAVPADDLDELFSRWDRDDSPGCSVAVYRDGEVAWARGYGMANLEHGIPNAGDTVFRLDSSSKQFTAAAVALLHLDGRLDFEGEVTEWFPDLPAYSAPITVRHLVHHTSGLRDYLGLRALAGRDGSGGYTDGDVVVLLCRQRATNFPVGSEFLYTNSGYVLMAMIPKRMGTSMREVCEERIFGPLGMAATHVHDDHREIVAKRATGYQPHGDGFRICETTLDFPGDGGVFSTVEELCAWDRSFYDASVAGQELVDLMLQKGRLAGGDEIPYAFGLMHGTLRGVPTVHHGGAFVGFRSQLVRVPDHRLSVALLANCADVPTSLADRVVELCLEAAGILEKQPGTEERLEAEVADVPVTAFADRVGWWEDPKTGVAVSVEVGDDAMVFTGWPAPERWRPVSPDALAAVDTPTPLVVRFEQADADDVAAMVVEVAGEVAATLKPLPPYEMSGRERAALAGEYRSDELDVSYRLESVGEELRVVSPQFDKPQVHPLSSTRFRMPIGTATFDEDRRGFSLDAGRVKGIRFER